MLVRSPARQPPVAVAQSLVSADQPLASTSRNIGRTLFEANLDSGRREIVEASDGFDRNRGACCRGCDEEAAAVGNYVACVGSCGETMFDFARTSAETGTFTAPDESEVEQRVAIDDISTVEQFMSSLAADDVATCLAENAKTVLEAALENPDPDDPPPDDLTIGDVVGGRLNVLAAGDETVGYRLTIPLTTGGFELSLITDLVATRVGNSISGLTIQSSLTPFDAAELDRIVQLSAERLGGEPAAPTSPAEVAPTASESTQRAVRQRTTDAARRRARAGRRRPDRSDPNWRVLRHLGPRRRAQQHDTDSHTSRSHRRRPIRRRHGGFRQLTRIQSNDSRAG